MIKKHILLANFIYGLLRIILFYIFNSEAMINDVGDEGTLIIFTILVAVEITIISIPFLFTNLLKMIFDKKFKIYFYCLVMLVIHTSCYVFLPNNVNVVNVYFFEIILILTISFLINFYKIQESDII